MPGSTAVSLLTSYAASFKNTPCQAVLKHSSVIKRPAPTMTASQQPRKKGVRKSQTVTKRGAPSLALATNQRTRKTPTAQLASTICSVAPKKVIKHA